MDTYVHHCILLYLWIVVTNNRSQGVTRAGIVELLVLWVSEGVLYSSKLRLLGARSRSSPTLMISMVVACVHSYVSTYYAFARDLGLTHHVIHTL